MGIPSDDVVRYEAIDEEEEEDIEDSEEEDSDSDSEYETNDGTDSYSDNSEENDQIIRCKWIGDGSETLDDLIARLEHFAEHVRDLKRDGWELRRVMDDDYGFMHKVDVPMPVQAVDPEPIEPHTP
jgi:hypothetical protein